jgi:outer membrane murein-binding lipoprotein Lpp
MALPLFNTLKFIETLLMAGIPDRQAKAIMEAQNVALVEMLEITLPTKQDMRDVTNVTEELTVKIDKLDNKVDRVETELSAKMDRLHNKIDRVEIELSAKIDRLDNKIDRVEADLAAKIEKVDIKFTGKFNLLYWVGSFLLASNATILFKLFHLPG